MNCKLYCIVLSQVFGWYQLSGILILIIYEMKNKLAEWRLDIYIYIYTHIAILCWIGSGCGCYWKEWERGTWPVEPVRVWGAFTIWAFGYLRNTSAPTLGPILSQRIPATLAFLHCGILKSVRLPAQRKGLNLITP